METKTYGSITITKVEDGQNGLSIVWKGELSTEPTNPEVNWVYKNTNNGIVYIYNGTQWEPMVLDGSDGADGTNGTNGLSVFITYNDSSTNPDAPTGDGTSNGWHTNSTTDVVWMSQKIATDATSGAWGAPIKIKGDDGQDGDDGVGIVSQTEQYYKSTTTTKPSSSDSDWETRWSTEFSSDWDIDTKNLWQRQQILWSNGETTYVGLMLMDEYDIASVLAEKAGTSVGEWCIANNKTIINGGVIMTGTIGADQIKSNWIEAKHLKSDYLSSLSANIGEIKAGSLQSADFIDKEGVYSEQGTKIDLTNDYIKSKNFAIDTNGDAHFNGTVHATAGDIGGCEIVDGQLTVDKLATLSADMGEITAGSIESSYYYDGDVKIIEWGSEEPVATASNLDEEPMALTNRDDDASLMMAAFDSGEVMAAAEPTSDEYFSFTAITWLGAIKSYDIRAKDVNNMPENVILPSTYKDLPVTKVGYNAFKNCTLLQSIIIPDSVNDIDNNAFTGCNSLVEITVPFIGTGVGDVRSYLGGIFGANTDSDNDVCVPTSLKKVTITSVTSIPYGAFRYCRSLTSVVISDSVTYIGAIAFQSCDSLTSVVIPNSVTSIGDSAFQSCSSLTSVVIPDSVTQIGAGAFYGCSRLTIYCEAASQPSGWNAKWNSSNRPVIWNFKEFGSTEEYDYAITNDNNVTLMLYKGSETEIVIPSTINGNAVIDSGTAFKGNANITSIVIPDSVTSIDSEAFANCDGLTSIVIPDSVTSIGSQAFNNCNSLMVCCKAKSRPSGWSDKWNVSNCPVVWGVVEWRNNNKQYDYCVTYTGQIYLTRYKENEINLVIPSILDTYYVVSLGIAFKRNTTITSVTIPTSVTFIEKYAFVECTSLQSVICDRNSQLTLIDANAFSGCSSLKSVVIPESVTSIEENAFQDDSALQTIYYGGENASDWNAITKASGNTSLDSATIYYYSETNPESSGFWHYDKTPTGFKISCEDQYMISSPYFKVTQDGNIIAINASLSGMVNAQTGYIGNWEISAGKLQNSEGSVGLNNNLEANGIVFWAGDNFKVTNTGTLTAKCAEFGNEAWCWKIYSNTQVKTINNEELYSGPALYGTAGLEGEVQTYCYITPNGLYFDFRGFLENGATYQRSITWVDLMKKLDQIKIN
jgi:hypothetical protein